MVRKLCLAKSWRRGKVHIDAQARHVFEIELRGLVEARVNNSYADRLSSNKISKWLSRGEFLRG